LYEFLVEALTSSTDQFAVEDNHLVLSLFLNFKEISFKGLAFEDKINEVFSEKDQIRSTLPKFMFAIPSL